MKRKYPWFAEQTWRNIFFFHWPVESGIIKKFIPEPFQLDLFAGKAWLSVVVFSATNSRFRQMPNGLTIPPVTQINFRTYVYPRGSVEKGVFFLSIHLNHIIAALGGKFLFNLPFQYVNVALQQNEQSLKIISPKSNLLNVHYKNKNTLTDNQLAQFLTERYCIWNVKGKQIIKIPISHSKWTVQKLETDVKENELFVALNVPRVNPITYFCQSKHAKLFPFEQVGLMKN